MATLSRNERIVELRNVYISDYLFAYNAAGLLILPDIGGIIRQLMAAICAGEIEHDHCAITYIFLCNEINLGDIIVMNDVSVVTKYCRLIPAKLEYYTCFMIKKKYIILYDKYGQSNKRYSTGFIRHNELFATIAEKYTYMSERTPYQLLTITL